jgi:hypothetical protein
MDVIADCARLLGRAGRWQDGIALCESVAVPDPGLLLVRAVIAVDAELFGGRPGAREALDAARAAHEGTAEWRLAYTRHRYTGLIAAERRDGVEVVEVINAFADLAETSDDADVAGWALFHEGLACESLCQDKDRARLRYEAALGYADRVSDPLLASYCLRHLAVHERESGDPVYGKALAFQSLGLRLSCGAMPLAAAQLIQVGEILLDDGDTWGARRAAEQAASIANELRLAERFVASAHELLVKAAA